MLEPMPRDRYRRRNAMHDLIMAVAIILFVGLIILVARHAHAAPDASAVLDPSMQMQVPVVAPVQLVTATPPVSTGWQMPFEMRVLIVLTGLAVLGLLLRWGLKAIPQNEWLKHHQLVSSAFTLAAQFGLSIVQELQQTERANGTPPAQLLPIALDRLKTQLGATLGVGQPVKLMGGGSSAELDRQAKTIIEASVLQVKAATPAANKAEVLS